MSLARLQRAWKRIPATRRRQITMTIDVAALLALFVWAGVNIPRYVMVRALTIFALAPVWMGMIANQSWSLAARRTALTIVTVLFAAVMVWFMLLPFSGSWWAVTSIKAGSAAYLLLGVYIAEREWRYRLLEPDMLYKIIQLAVARMELELHLERIGCDQGLLTADAPPSNVMVRYSNGNWLKITHPNRIRSWPLQNAYYILYSNGRHVVRRLRHTLGRYCEIRGKRQLAADRDRE